MRIIKKSEFYLLPSGTLFSEYQPCIFTGLKIKGDTCYRDNGTPFDYYEMDLTDCMEWDDSGDRFEKLDKAQEDSSYSLKLDLECEGRNGMYDDDQLYAVYESDDIAGLISKLQSCKASDIIKA